MTHTVSFTADQIAATADWAISQHLTGIPADQRPAVCDALVAKYNLPFSGAQLLTWCRAHQTLDQRRIEEADRRGLVSLADLRGGEDGEDLDLPDQTTEADFTPSASGEDRGEIVRQLAALIDSNLAAATMRWDRSTRRDRTIPRGGEITQHHGPGSATIRAVETKWHHGAVILTIDGAPVRIWPEARVVRWPYSTNRGETRIRIEFIGPVTITPAGPRGGRPRIDPVRLTAERVGNAALAFFRRTMHGTTEGQGTKQRRHYHDRQLAAKIQSLTTRKD